MVHEWHVSTQNWLEGVKDLLFPPCCLVCSVSPAGGSSGICNTCLQKVSPLKSPLCPVCGLEMTSAAGDGHLCGSCLRRKPSYSSARAIVHYQDPVTTLLHRLKYQGDITVFPALQNIVAQSKPFATAENERVIPVPLHIHRLRQRGFNQSLLLANLFFPENRASILPDTLHRIRHTAPQTGLDGTMRRKNVRKAFAVRKGEQVRGKKILLVDDVFTTGTTVDECSKVLLTAGAREVHVLTLARVK